MRLDTFGLISYEKIYLKSNFIDWITHGMIRNSVQQPLQFFDIMYSTFQGLQFTKPPSRNRTINNLRHNLSQPQKRPTHISDPSPFPRIPSDPALDRRRPSLPPSRPIHRLEVPPLLARACIGVCPTIPIQKRSFIFAIAVSDFGRSWAPAVLPAAPEGPPYIVGSAHCPVINGTMIPLRLWVRLISFVRISCRIASRVSFAHSSRGSSSFVALCKDRHGSASDLLFDDSRAEKSPHGHRILWQHATRYRFSVKICLLFFSVGFQRSWGWTFQTANCDWLTFVLFVFLTYSLSVFYRCSFRSWWYTKC